MKIFIGIIGIFCILFGLGGGLSPLVLESLFAQLVPTGLMLIAIACLIFKIEELNKNLKNKEDKF